MSAVEEIQAGALDRSVPVIDLLRRVKLASSKLKLTGTLEWVDRELNGYFGDNDQVPPYRIASGMVMHESPIYGSRPVNGDPEMINVLSVAAFREPIGALEAMLNLSGNRVVMSIDVDLAKSLAQIGNRNRFTIHFSKSVVVMIADSVRNLVLDWAIKLEEEGICGEGVSFTMEEKKKAAEVAPNVQITNYGHLHQGDTHGHQNRTVIDGVDASSNTLSIDVFEQVQSTIKNNVEKAADRDVLLALVSRMREKKGTTGFKEAYSSFLVSAANHMTILAPFLPALSTHLAG